MQIKRLENLLQMLENQPDDSFLLYATALEYLSANEGTRAWGYFEKLLKTHPDYLPTYYQAGIFQMDMGNNDMARELFSKGMELAKSTNDMKTWHELEGMLEEID